jgi:hypothetical protein
MTADELADQAARLAGQAADRMLELGRFADAQQMADDLNHMAGRLHVMGLHARAAELAERGAHWQDIAHRQAQMALRGEK